jgi:hypothetical protein
MTSDVDIHSILMKYFFKPGTIKLGLIGAPSRDISIDNTGAVKGSVPKHHNPRNLIPWQVNYKIIVTNLLAAAFWRSWMIHLFWAVPGALIGEQIPLSR